MTVLGWAGIGTLGIGVLVAVLGVVGVYRMPDFYLRLKPFSLVTTVGAVGIHVGVSLATPDTYSYKGLLTAMVFLMTGPALCQALLFTAHRLRVPSHNTRDELREVADRLTRDGFP